MIFFPVEDRKIREILPGIRIASVYQEDLMVTFVDFDPHKELPIHSHPHRQITIVIEGKLEMTVDGEGKRLLLPGDAAVIPPNSKHGAKVLEEPTRVQDSWHPIREDYIVE